ncbi:elongation factor P [Mycoplasmatota bacterium WC44]
MISTNEFKTGVTIEYDGHIWQVIEFQHVKPGKGAAFVRTKLRNLRTRAVVDKTFRSAEKMPKAHIDKQTMSYSYSMGNTYVFMNNETYEQIEIESNVLGEATNFLIEGMDVTITTYQNEIIGIQVPEKVTLEVTEADPGVKGNTAANATKNAKVETGYELQVPLFVEPGTRIVINTSTGKYDTRA